ncbi:sulfotransferase [Bacillus sp. BHET2]|uniref:sulfotransferase family protein n=1 Tax=Bacillus sp. BHET2 TaxID=2583818 RepID=UPI00110D9B0D|nr:sulfotransferase [Bacillus sp. BHET2]TMU83922.1 sulfotransferase [Bacillus sp. BHET2]
MNNQNALVGPVVIGGVGGSGTRIVTEIVKQIGFFMGNDTNFANDNIALANLFFKQEWYKEFTRMEEELFLQKLKEFEQSTLHSLELHSPNSIGWGWKKPPTHIYLDYLSHYFPHLKYIHVIRNGLDMAYSHNQNQPHHLGHFFAISVPESETLQPKASLDYWIKANQRAIHLGKSLLGKRFYVIRYEKLCENPNKEITRLINFLDPTLIKRDINELTALISKPKTIDRYKQEDLSIFTKKDIQSVRELGFEID